MDKETEISILEQKIKDTMAYADKLKKKLKKKPELQQEYENMATVIAIHTRNLMELRCRP